MKALDDYLPGSIKGKTILITGGTTGIGRATAILFSKLGADIMIVGLDEKHLADALEDIQGAAKGRVHGIIADLGHEEGIQNVFKEVDKTFKKLDILINNAGLAYGSVTEGDYKDWQGIVNTNLLSYMACSSEAAKRMPRYGHIVNIGSMSADTREGASSVYVATKSAIQGFSEALRKQLNKEGIKITLIEPGAVDTDMQEQPHEEKLNKVRNLKMLKATDIAVSILYCLSQPMRCDVVELKLRPHLQLI